MTTAAVPPVRRSLILAGGGLKVAFQAGVLQVLLDEAKLQFDHVDGASGGVFNLAMYCQGMSGAEIADNWRRLDSLAGIAIPWRQWLKLPVADSLFSFERYRKNVFTAWGLDWNTIRQSKRDATFNVYNFSKHRLEVLAPAQMSEDHLVACVSLPLWFPPVQIDGDRFIDAVFITDANLEEALRPARAINEIWLIWTVSERAEWRPGPINAYFQIIETSANGHLRRIISRIEAHNAAVAAHGAGEFGTRPFRLRVLRAEVPVHYLLNLSSDRLAHAVERGVQAARRWCAAEGIPFVPLPESDAGRREPLEFRERMRGHISFGERDHCRGAQEGRRSGTSMTVQLRITIDDVRRFVTHPTHRATARGYVRCEALGGKLEVECGSFHLFVDEGEPARKEMRYRLFIRDAARHPLTMSGVKKVEHDDGFDLWRDTTTLFTDLYRGHIEREQEPDAEHVAAGVIRVHLRDFARQMTTFRAGGPGGLRRRAGALARFGGYFAGSLWDVYGRSVLSTGPV